MVSMDLKDQFGQAGNDTAYSRKSHCGVDNEHTQGGSAPRERAGDTRRDHSKESERSIESKSSYVMKQSQNQKTKGHNRYVYDLTRLPWTSKCSKNCTGCSHYRMREEKRA